MASAADRFFERAMQCHREGQLQEADSLCRKALKVAPAHADALNLLGVTLLRRADPAGGLPYLDKAIAIAPRHAQAHNNRGNAMQALGLPEQAIACYQKALSVKPDYASAYNNLGNVLKELKRYDEATVSFRSALSINREFAQAHNNLGNTLLELGEVEQAHASYAKALAVDPGYAAAHSNLGTVLRDLNRHAEAMHSYERALALQPGFSEALWNRSHALLAQGSFEQGWSDYEMRWKQPGKPPLAPTPFPCWLGREPIAGKTLLVQSEQGLGDAVQMLRYVPLLQRQGVRCWLQLQTPLLRLARRSFPDAQVIEEPRFPAAADFRIPIMSLPLAMRTFSEEAIPREVPYLRCDPARAGHWGELLASWHARAQGPWVGISWRGNPEHKNDRQRSASLTDLAPLFTAQPSTGFVALQKFLTDAERAALAAWPNVCVLDEELMDLDETAAVMSVLDAVISVDSAPAHLAGALGIATWLLLPFNAEWRWQDQRPDSPWYPSLRLLRQGTRGDWRSPVSQLVAQRWCRYT